MPPGAGVQFPQSPVARLSHRLATPDVGADMTQTCRFVAFLVAAPLVIALAGCSSYNEGKIVGKWKVVEYLEYSPPPPGPAPVEVFYEFTADGRFFILASVLSSGGRTVAKGNYLLNSGHWVTLTNLEPMVDGQTQARQQFVIDGDSMTIESNKGKKQTLTRVKD